MIALTHNAPTGESEQLTYIKDHDIRPFRWYRIEGGPRDNHLVIASDAEVTFHAPDDKGKIKEYRMSDKIAQAMTRVQSPDLVGDIQAFHKKFGQLYSGPPRTLPHDLELFRCNFIAEEHEEFVTADSDEKRLDACVDMVYVILGYCHLRGWDFNEAWRRVQAANMLKALASEVPNSRSRHPNDIVKPPGWTHPVLDDLVIDYTRPPLGPYPIPDSQIGTPPPFDTNLPEPGSAPTARESLDQSCEVSENPASESKSKKKGK
jgi:predicted HAD superfamily Cof-like phosphohydrolase